ncbi:MAG TPA: DUF5700 domain-containing putative Zn-dependent protease [Gemmatimonadaceae bacterium]|nr:DUF5700 domain-containing putative Zn-dependent protease [Gemmatimonadaceae bacterium]
MLKLVVAAVVLIPSAGSARFGAVAAQGPAPPITMQLNYDAAEAMIAALERDSLTDAGIDSLWRIPGVRAMVDNIIHFQPGFTPADFPHDLRYFIKRKKEYRNARNPGLLSLASIWQTRGQVRVLVRDIRSREQAIVDGIIAQLSPYAPRTGPLHLTVYFVAGGVSDGFVFDRPGASAFYANLVRAGGDVNGAISNMAHETYHVMQKAAQRQAGLTRVADATDSLPPLERLLAVTLAEGTANFAVDPTRTTAPGPNIDASRARYRRNEAPARIAENFALFDRVANDLVAGRMNWYRADELGFSGNNDARFYFVGRVIAAAIERYCGAQCVANAFERPPAEFYRAYIALYRKHPEMTARFDARTELLIESLR